MGFWRFPFRCFTFSSVAISVCCTREDAIRRIGCYERGTEIRVSFPSTSCLSCLTVSRGELAIFHLGYLINGERDVLIFLLRDGVVWFRMDAAEIPCFFDLGAEMVWIEACEE